MSAGSFLSSSLDSTKHLSMPESDDGSWSYDVHPDFVIERLTRTEREFRHSGWAVQRRKVFEGLVRTGCRGQSLQAFVECGSGCWVQHSGSRSRYRLVCNCCRSRWCVPCGVARAARLRASVGDQLKQWERVRFITLTLRARDCPLADQIDRLQACFRELKKRPEWKSNVDGCAAFLEVKIGQKSGLWHVHLHCLAVGRWIDQRDLSRAWLAVTGDSSIVDVKLAKSTNGVAAYVTKYVTKPLDSSVLASPDRLDEAIVALRGRRLCNGSGTLRKISADAATDDGLDDWHTIGRLDDLLNDARVGDEAAAAILSLLRDRSTDSPAASATGPPHPS